MDIEFLIQRLEKYVLEECPKIPLSGNRAISEEELRTQIGQIRDSIPEEVPRARRIVKQQEEILIQARHEAEKIIAEAQVEAKDLIGEHRIAQEAKQQAALIRQQAEQDVRALRAEADEYVFDMLSQLQEELSRSQRVVENGLRKLEADRERRKQG